MCWQERAACAPSNRPEGMSRAAWTAQFFPPAGEPLERVKAICEGCPVRDRCAAEALTSPKERHGVWGGMSSSERWVMPPRRRRAAPIRHGTEGGYRAHLRAGTKACELCKWAHRENQRARLGMEVAS